MTQPNNFASLYRKLMDNECSPEEVDQLLQWLSADQPDPLTEDLVHEQLNTAVPEDAITDDIRNRLELRLQAILEKQEQSPAVHRVHFMRRWGWAAASIIVVLAIGAYFWLNNGSVKEQPKEIIVNNKTDVAPGRNGAILTLADGSKVLLDSMSNGNITMETGTNIQLKDGELSYGKGSNTTDIRFNTMTTPNGRQFTVVLPDGTKVWMNAASSLRYPTIFTGAERKVEITGEAYFEVAKNAAMPFRAVVNKSTEVEVLGTAFNISSYENDMEIKTTLVEGAVKVIADNNAESNINSKVLKPGQQARISNASRNRGTLTVSDNTDIGKVLAWKNGTFNFNGVKVEEAMKQLERWYDIKVIYTNGIPDVTFFGEINRESSLSGVLKGLEGAGVHFSIEEGKKLLVYP